MGSGEVLQRDDETKREIYLQAPTFTNSARLKLIERGRTYRLEVSSGAGYVQVGCTRITRDAWKQIVKLAR